MLSLLLLFFFVSLTVSLLCSLWEAVLLSITPSFVQRKLDKDVSYAKLLSSFKTNIDRPLAALLTLNTVAHTAGAIGVGQQASLIWAESSPIITAFVIPAVMTMAILIFSEIIPKTIGALNWRKLAPVTVYSLNVVIIALYPMVVLCQWITAFLSRNKTHSLFSRHDLLALAQIGSKEGKLKSLELATIENILKLNELTIKDIMTPRTVMTAAPEEVTVAEFYEAQGGRIPFTRIPVYEDGNPDNITGFVLKTDILENLVTSDSKGTALKKLARPIEFKPSTYTVFSLFNDSVRGRNHVYMVSDEYGSVLGVVTMEDILESLIGHEIVDETDEVVDMQELAKNQSKIRLESRGDYPEN